MLIADVLYNTACVLGLDSGAFWVTVVDIFAVVMSRVVVVRFDKDDVWLYVVVLLFGVMAATCDWSL